MCGDRDAAWPHFREARRLQPENWTYKRQAWQLADPFQGRTEVMEGSWLDDVKEIGTIESQPLLDGRNMVMLLGPTKNAGVRRDAESENTERSEEAVQGDGGRQDHAPADDAQPQPGAQVVEEEAQVHP